MLIRSISSTNDELQNLYVYMDTDTNIKSNFVFQNLPKSTETDIDWGQTRLQTESEAVRTLMLRNLHNYSNNTVFEYALERAKAVICSDAVTPAALKEAITWHYLAGVERIIQAAPELLACNIFMWDTPLTWAVFCADDTDSSLTESSLDVIKLLLAANADINFRLETLHGNETALSRAIEKMNVDVLLFLLNQGADVTKIDKYGLTQKQKGNLIDYLFAEYRFIHGNVNTGYPLNKIQSLIRALVPAMIRSGVSLDELKRSQHTAAAVWPIECMDLDAYAANVLQEKGIGDTQLIPAQCTQPNKVASFLSNPPTHQLTLFATRPADQPVTPSIAQPDPLAAQPADDFVLVDGEEIDTDWDIIEASINRAQSPG